MVAPTPRINILHLSILKNWGGGENHFEDLCCELKKSNPELKNFILCPKNHKFHPLLKDSEIVFETARLQNNFDSIKYCCNLPSQLEARYQTRIKIK